MLKIAIISPTLAMSVIEKIIEEKQYNCKFYIYTYENVEEILDIYEDCHDKVDGIFLSGERGYIYLNENIRDLSIPCKFVFYDTAHVLTLLLNFVLEHPNIPLNRVYIDFLVPFNNYYGIKEYIKKEHLPMCNESNNIDYEDMLKRAKSLWDNGKIDIMLTRCTTDLKNIENSGIPFIHIVPDEKVISNSIEDALAEMRLKKAENSPKVICLIQPFYKNTPSLNEREYVEISMYKDIVDIKKVLNKNINITHIFERFELLFYDEEEDLNLKSIRYILKTLRQNKEYDFNIGVGISSNFDNSRYLAEKALKESIEYGVNDGFAVYDNENIVGPLSKDNTITYNVNNTSIDTFAKKNNIDVGNMHRILGLYNKNKDLTFNSEILSKWLNITQRSCNRIILQLLEHNLIEQTQAPQSKTKGRPPKYYKFLSENVDAMFFD